MNASLDLYKIFYRVAQKQSITLASEELYISQPAVSQSLKQLESQLGCKLFTRLPKGVRLTAEGETLFGYVKEGMEQIDIGEKKVAELLNLESGEIRIGASDMTLQFFLLPYLEHFHTRWPSIKISVTNGSTPETLALLSQNKIDFGVVSEPFETSSKYSVLSVMQVQDTFVCGTRFRNMFPSPVPLSALAEQPIICLERNTSTRRYVDSFFESRGVTLTPAFELATSYIIVHFAKRNLGIGSVVRDFALDELYNGSLMELELEEKIPSRSFCIVRGRNVMSRAADKLLSEILP